MSGRGAGADGAATPVSLEKSMLRPPKGDATGAEPDPLCSALSDPGNRTEAPALCAPVGCLLIDANIPPRRPYPGGVSSVASCVAQLGDDLRSQQLELVRFVHVADAEQDVLRAGVAHLSEPVDELPR